jgi:SagB-type dehydrogenase family enzyme
MRYANRHFDTERDLGELFLTNTKSNAQKVQENASIPEYFSSYTAPVTALSGTESVNSRERIPLPEPQELKLSLSTVMTQRKSVRSFSGDLIELKDLATIFYAASGLTHTSSATPIDGGPNFDIHGRSVPSAGGLYAVDCYCFAFNVRNLRPGVYKYSPHYHALDKLYPDVDVEEMKMAISGSEASGIDPSKLSTAILFVGNPQKLVRKYGARGVRYMLLEAGMMAFSANLAATALGYGSLDYQSFLDDLVSESLAISKRSVYVLHSLLLGWPVENNKERDISHA